MSLYHKLKSRLNIDADYKVLLSNFSYLTILQIVGYVFPLITLPYLSKIIGTNGFGKIAFASAIITWIQTIADWGFNYTATRDVAQNRDNKSKVSEILSNVLWARTLLAIGGLGILLLLIFFIPSFKDNSLIILLTFLMIPGHILFPDWFFQAIEKMRYIVIFNIVIKLLFTILVFVFIKSEDDYIYQPLFTSFGYIVCGIISMYIILVKFGYKLYRPQINTIFQTIKHSSDVFINNLAPNLYNSFSVILLSSTCGSVASGIYDGGNKIISIAHQFILVISRTFFPFLSRRQDKHSIFVKINLIIGLVCSILLFWGAPYIINILLSPEFVDSIIVSRILAISMFFMVLSNTYGTNYLIIIHKDRELRNITIVCSLLGLLLSYPLVKLYSFIGAALVVFISRCLLGICIYRYAQKCKRNRPKGS